MPTDTKNLIKGGATKYHAVYNDLADGIRTGRRPINQRLPTEKQLAEDYGVSVGTVVRALQTLVRQGMLTRRRGAGTYVSAAGPVHHEPKPSHLIRIGVVTLPDTIPDAVFEGEDVERGGMYYEPLYQGIRSAVTGRPVDLIHATRTGLSDYAAFARESSLDGIIVIAYVLSELPALRALVAAGIPFVAPGMSSRAEGDLQIPFVDTDNLEGSRAAVRHLLDLGHRRIGMINLATGQANQHDRLTGYMQALDDAGLSIDPADMLLYPTYDLGGFDERIQDWIVRGLERRSLPTAIFATDFMMAMTAVTVLRKSGVRVPEDVSVVGFDDPLHAAHSWPPMTTVRQPVYQLGRRAAERLIESLTAGELPRGTEILPTELIVRESTCPPASAAGAHPRRYSPSAEKETVA